MSEWADSAVVWMITVISLPLLPRHIRIFSGVERSLDVSRDPPSSAAIEIHAGISALVAGVHSFVSGVSKVRNHLHVAKAVVSPVSVFVVDLVSFRNGDAVHYQNRSVSQHGPAVKHDGDISLTAPRYERVACNLTGVSGVPSLNAARLPNQLSGFWERGQKLVQGFGRWDSLVSDHLATPLAWVMRAAGREATFRPRNLLKIDGFSNA
jgi:hypothetical protein